MAEIQLSNSPLVAIVDDKDFDKVNRLKWRITQNGYVCSGHSTKRLLHRFLMNPADNMSVDHINHNPLDNRRSNLRICTHAENMKNRTSSIGHVHFENASRKWIARRYENGKRLYLGRFGNKKEALNILGGL